MYSLDWRDVMEDLGTLAEHHLSRSFVAHALQILEIVFTLQENSVRKLLRILSSVIKVLTRSKSYDKKSTQFNTSEEIFYIGLIISRYFK